MKIVELALANLNQYLYDRDNFAYTERMREPGTGAGKETGDAGVPARG
jgi:hypothetical protein